MKALSLKQYAEILQYIQKHHAFGRYKTPEERIKGEYPLNIKYIDNSYDTRTMDVWSISLRGFGELRFSANTWSGVEKPSDIVWTNMYDWIMAYLNHEWKPDPVIHKWMYPTKD